MTCRDEPRAESRRAGRGPGAGRARGRAGAPGVVLARRPGGPSRRPGATCTSALRPGTRRQVLLPAHRAMGGSPGRRRGARARLDLPATQRGVIVRRVAVEVPRSKPGLRQGSRSWEHEDRNLRASDSSASKCPGTSGRSTRLRRNGWGCRGVTTCARCWRRPTASTQWARNGPSTRNHSSRSTTRRGQRDHPLTAENPPPGMGAGSGVGSRARLVWPPRSLGEHATAIRD